jgi:hypothetical protein
MTIYTEAKINHKLPPPEHRIGLSGSLALRCTAFSKCCAAQCQTLRETDLLLSRLPFVRFILAPVYMVLVSVCTLFNACCSLSLSLSLSLCLRLVILCGRWRRNNSQSLVYGSGTRTDHPPRTKGIARRISNTCYEQLLSTFVYCFRVYVLRLVLLMCVCLLFLLFVQFVGCVCV